MSHNKKNRNKQLVTLADGTKILRRKPKSVVNKTVACEFKDGEYICKLDANSQRRQCVFQGLFPDHDRDGKVLGLRIDCKKFEHRNDKLEGFDIGTCQHETARKYAHDKFVNSLNRDMVANSDCNNHIVLDESSETFDVEKFKERKTRCQIQS